MSFLTSLFSFATPSPHSVRKSFWSTFIIYPHSITCLYFYHSFCCHHLSQNFGNNLRTFKSKVYFEYSSQDDPLKTSFFLQNPLMYLHLRVKDLVLTTASSALCIPHLCPRHSGSLLFLQYLGILSSQDVCNCWSSTKNNFIPDSLVDISRSWFHNLSESLPDYLKSQLLTSPNTLSLSSLLYFSP